MFPVKGFGPWEDLQDYTCFLPAAVTGMRRGEVLALRWRNVSFEHSSIYIVEAWKTPHKLGAPKSNKSRTTPLPHLALEKLRDLRDDVLTCQPDDLVFCYPDGKRLGKHWWGSHFARALDKAGIDHQARNITPHKLRHTLNTILRGLEYDPAKIREALGWSQEATQNIYTHFQVEHLRGQADLIDAILQPE